MNFKKMISSRIFNYVTIIGVIALLFFLLVYFLFPISISNFSTSNIVVIKYADNISSAHQIVVDNFNKEYEGRIRVEPIDLPFLKFSTNERKELLTRSLRSKSDKLDVFAIDLIWSARFAKWAEPLEKYITQQEINSLLPQALRSCVINGSLTALPIYLDIGVLYYRSDLIQALPNGKLIEEKILNSITWEEFFELSKSFDKSDNPFFLFPADDYEGLVCSFVEILLNQNEDFFDETPLNWESDEVKNTFSLLSNIINKYKITPKIVTDYRENSCYDDFVYNQGIFLRGWASFPKGSDALLESTELIKVIKQAALPHLKGSKPISTIGGWNIMLSKYSEHKEEAAEFIKYIIKEESQKALYEIGALLPVISSVYADSSFTDRYPTLLENKQLLDNGVHRPLWDNYTKISDVISFYTNKVMKGQMNVDSAVVLTNKSLLSGELILR